MLRDCSIVTFAAAVVENCRDGNLRSKQQQQLGYRMSLIAKPAGQGLLHTAQGRRGVGVPVELH